MILTVWRVASLVAVKFDVGNNEFKLLPDLDLSVCEEGYAVKYELVDTNDCFTLMVCDKTTSNCVVNIYSLNEEECCVWTKIFSIGPLELQPQGFYMSHGFKYGGEILFHDGAMFFCYDYKTNTIKRLRNSFFSCLASCFRYTPSLVFLEGMKSVHLTTQTRTPGICSRTPRRLINSLRD